MALESYRDNPFQMIQSVIQSTGIKILIRGTGVKLIPAGASGRNGCAPQVVRPAAHN
jgi:hypothetical protein